MEDQEYNSCGNCYYMEVDMDECWCHLHRQLQENGESWCTRCPESFVCDDWEGEEFNDAHTDDNSDRCYECTGYGDDYYVNDEGDFVCACDDCPWNGDDDRWDD